MEMITVSNVLQGMMLSYLIPAFLVAIFLKPDNTEDDQ